MDSHIGIGYYRTLSVSGAELPTDYIAIRENNSVSMLLKVGVNYLIYRDKARNSR
jgi:hypothetical protein